jgi:hypothetical protein
MDKVFPPKDAVYVWRPSPSAKFTAVFRIMDDKGTATMYIANVLDGPEPRPKRKYTKRRK